MIVVWTAVLHLGLVFRLMQFKGMDAKLKSRRNLRSKVSNRFMGHPQEWHWRGSLQGPAKEPVSQKASEWRGCASLSHHCQLCSCSQFGYPTEPKLSCSLNSVSRFIHSSVCLCIIQAPWHLSVFFFLGSLAGGKRQKSELQQKPRAVFHLMSHILLFMKETPHSG